MQKNIHPAHSFSSHWTASTLSWILSQKGANNQKQPWLSSITSTQLFWILLPRPASPQFWTCQWRFCENNYSQFRCQDLRPWCVSHSFATLIPRLSSALHHFSYQWYSRLCHLPFQFQSCFCQTTAQNLSFDPNDLNSYRRVTNLPFLSKITEKKCSLSTKRSPCFKQTLQPPPVSIQTSPQYRNRTSKNSEWPPYCSEQW